MRDRFTVMPIMRNVLSLLVCAALSACITSPDRCVAAMPTDPATESFAPSLGIDLTQMTKTESGVYELDEVVGSGEALTNPTLVQVFYVAYLRDGTVVDQQLQQPFPLDLRTQGAIGIVDGMLGMNVGGRRKLVVPSQLALGACGRGPIPPNSTMIYEIELIAINP